MSDIEETTSPEGVKAAQTDSLADSWGTALTTIVCEECGCTYLAPLSATAQRRPYCHQTALERLDETKENPLQAQKPELVVPFSLSPGALEGAFRNFAKEIPFPPDDLEATRLSNRLQAIYLPMWLVDAEVQAAWQAEAGFDYEVVSHQERFEDNRNGWTTRQVNETKTRWEARLGRLKRSYQNIAAPALEAHNQILAQLGAFDIRQAEPYQAQAIQAALARLPDRSIRDAWPDARPAFQEAAVEECRQATGANKMRQFSWQPEFQNQNWSLLLLPVFMTYYLDDDKKPQRLLVHGQSGRVSGLRRASMRRAQHTAITLLVAAVVLFIISLAIATASIFLPPALAIGVLGIVAALLVALGATIPIAMVWWFNRNQAG